MPQRLTPDKHRQEDRPFLPRVPDLALMSNGQNANFFLGWHEPIQRDVSGLAKRDYQLSDVAADPTTDQRMLGEHVDAAANRGSSCDGALWVVLHEELEQAFEIRDRSGAIDYRRHGFGRRTFFPWARRSSQA